MLVVAALGGQCAATPRPAARGERSPSRTRSSPRACSPSIAREHRLVVTHGNGPQIGLLALQAEAYRDVRSYPLDLLGAESEGMIGYLLERELANALPERHVASLLTQTVVDALDPAFRKPTKPIGPVYDARDAVRLAQRARLERRRRRRPVATRRRVADPAFDRRALDDQAAARPRRARRVRRRWRRPDRRRQRRSPTRRRGRRRQGRGDGARSPADLGADLLLLLTDVPAVETGWGTEVARPIGADHGPRVAGAAIRQPGRWRRRSPPRLRS